MPQQDSKNKKSKGAPEKGTRAPLRVAELDRTPTLNDLYHAFESARNEQETPVELLFKIPDQESTYLLTVVCPEDPGVLPSWDLSRLSHTAGSDSCTGPDSRAGLGSSSDVDSSAQLDSSWIYTGDDVALIHVHLSGLSASPHDASEQVQTPTDFVAASVMIDTLQTFPFAHFAQQPQPHPHPQSHLHPQLTATLEAQSETELAPFYAPIAKDFPSLRQHHELLLQPETGIFAQWSMMYFLEQEYYRFKACNYPVVLGLYDFAVVVGDESDALPASYIREIGHRIARAKRRIDLFGHFGVTICALMLPHTEYDAGNKVAQRIKKIIEDDAHNRGLPLIVKMGVAGMPIDANDVNGLINEAAERMC